MDKQQQIKHRLAKIEADHGVRILYACEAGSRAWGFPSPASDYDVRFIYVKPVEQYLYVERYLKETQPQDHIAIPRDDDLDFHGWDLRKALAMMARSDMTLLELLDSPVIYRMELSVYEQLRKSGQRLFNPTRVWGHYLSLVNRVWVQQQGEAVIGVKPYLYITRALCAALWVQQHETLPPTHFPQLLDKLRLSPEVRREIETLLLLKRESTPPVLVARLPNLMALLFDTLPNVNRKFEHRRAEETDYLLLDDVFRSVTRTHAPQRHPRAQD